MKKLEENYSKLVAKLINHLRKHEDANKPYMAMPKYSRTLSRNDLANEIENQTDIGLDLISNMIMLAHDLVDRGRETAENVKTAENNK